MAALNGAQEVRGSRSRPSVPCLAGPSPVGPGLAKPTVR